MRFASALISLTFFFSLTACDDGSSKKTEIVCGNNVAETGEACDGTDFAGMTCASFGRVNPFFS